MAYTIICQSLLDVFIWVGHEISTFFKVPNINYDKYFFVCSVC